LRAIVSFIEDNALLRCSGDEDRTTQGSRRRALSRALRARSDVVVDLSELRFADASLMVDLAMLARRLRQHGQALRLRGASPYIRTLIEVVGIDRLPGILFESGSTQALA
jgi:anti-anti-sigma factor